MFKGEKGITLVALVVTIVVLLILAGVSISLVVGQNGMITKATESKKAQEKAYAQDMIQDALKAMEIDVLSGKTVAKSTESLVENYLDVTGFEKGTTDTTIKYTGKSGTYTFTVEFTNYTIEPEQ